jgi:CheY-like chemotaxis protein
MIERVLLVDDEEPLLKAYRRFLQPVGVGDGADGRRSYEVETLSDPEAALDRIAHQGPFAVVVSDYKMPKLDGIRFLERVKGLAPDTVRVMLTGGADVTAAVDAVNCGALFRFLTKPCLPAVLVETVAAALRQHQLIAAERELLEQTVSGVVRVLMDTLTLVNPTVSTRGYRMRRCVRHMVKTLGLADAWQLEVAAMLSQFGQVVLGGEAGEASTPGGSDHALLAQELLGHIPRFEEVAAIIGRQAAPIDPADITTPFQERDRVTFGGHVLRTALEFEAATADGQPAADAIARLVRRSDLDPALVRCLADVDADLQKLTPRTLPRILLRPGMVLDEDLKSSSGALLMARGHEVSEAMLARMMRMAATDWLRAPVKVLVSQVTQFEPLPPRLAAPAAARSRRSA